jgi:hypothetical protein
VPDGTRRIEEFITNDERLKRCRAERRIPPEAGNVGGRVVDEAHVPGGIGDDDSIRDIAKDGGELCGGERRSIGVGLR